MTKLKGGMLDPGKFTTVFLKERKGPDQRVENMGRNVFRYLKETFREGARGSSER